MNQLKFKEMLLEPNQNYKNYIERSANYLNCPKHMLNHDLDCMYRQGIVINTETAIKNVKDFLNEIGYNSPEKNAKEFVGWRNSISLNEFNSINVNSYIEKLPLYIQKLHERINKWYDDHTTYYSAIYGGGIKSVASYPFVSFGNYFRVNKPN